MILSTTETESSLVNKRGYTHRYTVPAEQAPGGLTTYLQIYISRYLQICGCVDMLSNLDIYSMETEDHVHAWWTRVSAGGQVTVASRRAGDRTSRVARSYLYVDM